jgi:hypothetical protein
LNGGALRLVSDRRESGEEDLVSKPEVKGIRQVAPDGKCFRFKDVNVFYVVGENLNGVEVLGLAGKVDKGGKLVTWTGIETLCNTDPQRLLVKGTPDKAKALGVEPVEEEPIRKDPGSIAVSLSGGVTQQVPVDYDG